MISSFCRDWFMTIHITFFASKYCLGTRNGYDRSGTQTSFGLIIRVVFGHPERYNCPGIRWYGGRPKHRWLLLSGIRSGLIVRASADTAGVRNRCLFGHPKRILGIRSVFDRPGIYRLPKGASLRRHKYLMIFHKIVTFPWREATHFINILPTS